MRSLETKTGNVHAGLGQVARRQRITSKKTGEACPYGSTVQSVGRGGGQGAKRWGSLYFGDTGLGMISVAQAAHAYDAEESDATNWDSIVQIAESGSEGAVPGL